MPAIYIMVVPISEAMIPTSIRYSENTHYSSSWRSLYAILTAVFTPSLRIRGTFISEAYYSHIHHFEIHFSKECCYVPLREKMSIVKFGLKNAMKTGAVYKAFSASLIALSGHVLRHRPHPRHRFPTNSNVSSTISRAPKWHISTHKPQFVQDDVSVAAI